MADSGYRRSVPVLTLAAMVGLALGLFLAFDWWWNGQSFPDDARRIAGRVVRERQGVVPESVNLVEVRYTVDGRVRTASFPVAGTKGSDPGDVVYRPGEEVHLLVAAGRPQWAVLALGPATGSDGGRPDLWRAVLALAAGVVGMVALFSYRRRPFPLGRFRRPWP